MAYKIHWLSRVSDELDSIFQFYRLFARVLLDEEAKQLILRRRREIKSGRMRLIPHEEVMSEMDALLREYEG